MATAWWGSEESSEPNSRLTTLKRVHMADVEVSPYTFLRTELVLQ